MSGDPLPENRGAGKNRFREPGRVHFSFELGLAPAIDLTFSKKDKANFYEITIDEKMKNDYITSYARRFGEFRKAETKEEKDILKGKIEVLDQNGNVDPEGISSWKRTLAMDIIKDEEIRKNSQAREENDSIDLT